LQANGGNVVVMTQGTITQASVNSSGNTFVARGIGLAANAANSTGGGIELGSGTTGSQLQGLLSQPPHNSLFNNATLGVTLNETHASVVVNEQNTSQINLNVSGTTSSLNLNQGAIQFDAVGTGSSVKLNGATFTTSGLKPISMVTPAAPDSDAIHIRAIRAGRTARA